MLFAVLDRREASQASHAPYLAAYLDDRAKAQELDVIDGQAEHLGLTHPGSGAEVATLHRASSQ